MTGRGRGAAKGPRPCYWCEKKGHLYRNCPQYHEDRKKGLVCICKPLPHRKFEDESCPLWSRDALPPLRSTNNLNFSLPHTSSTPPPTMANRTAFREQKAPDATFRFPHGFDAFKNVSDTAEFEAIAKATGCKLTPEAVRDTMGVKIFGNRNQCADAIGQLRAWSYARDKAIRKTVAFPHVNSYNPTKDELALRKAAFAERRKNFRADPDTRAISGKSFKHASVLKYQRCDWMNDTKILGSFMEALDPIRMDSQCHIIYMTELPVLGVEYGGAADGSRLGQGFFLCGNNRELINQAVGRLNNLDKQINGRKIEAPEHFLVKPVAFPLDYNAHVIKHQTYPAPRLYGRISARDDHIMQLKKVSGFEPDFLPAERSDIHSLAELDTGSILMGNKNLTSLNIQYIDVWLTTMLERLHCWQGYLKMRILIGTCAFETYRCDENEHGLHDFEDMVEERNAEGDGIQGYMTTELGDLQTETTLLGRFLDTGHSLAYKDYDPGHAVYPHCTAIFKMKSPWISAEALRLKAVFVENGYGEYNLDTHQWEILESDDEHEKKMVDIKLVDLKHSHTSTGISVIAGVFVTESQKAKLPGWSLYERFLKNISVIPENVKSNVKDRLMFDFDENNGKTGVHLLFLEQRKSYNFEISEGPGRGYHVELFSFQMSGLRKHTLFPENEQRWGVQLRHPSWDTLFSDHQCLEIGMQANWEPAEWQFFPPAGEHIDNWQNVEGTQFEVGSGYKNMLDAVNVVEKIIHGEGSPPPPVKSPVKQKENGSGRNPFNPRLNGNKGKAVIPGKKVLDGGLGGEKKNMIVAERKPKRPEQHRYQAHSVAVAQGKPTGNALDLIGLEILPVDKTKLTGASLDLADLFM